MTTVTQTDVWINTLNPFLVKFPESWGVANFGIRWYGMAYLTGFVVGALLITWLARRGKTTMPVDKVSDFATAMAIGTMVGGRLGYCLFYQPSLFWTFREHFPYWDVLAVHEGGMASHGGIAGVAIACILFARANNLNLYHTWDLTTLGGAIGIFFGRIANFINGELVGRPAPEGLSWAVKFPQDMATWAQVNADKGVPHMDQLQTITPAVEKLGVTAEQWGSYLKLMRQDFGMENMVRNILHQLIEATQNGNQEIARLIGPALTARYPSQLIEALLEGLLVLLVTLYVWRKPQKPGVISAVWFVVYASVRIFSEQFRMPDAHIGFQALGLTRGQWLSVGMLIFALTILFLWSRRNVPKMGGWMEKTVPDTTGSHSKRR